MCILIQISMKSAPIDNKSALDQVIGPEQATSHKLNQWRFRPIKFYGVSTEFAYSGANVGKYMSATPSYCCYFKRSLLVMPWLLIYGKSHFFWSWIRPFVSHGTVPVMPLLLFCQPSMAQDSLRAMTHLDRCRILWGIHTSGFGYPVRRFS